MPATYTISIDINDNGSFADTGENRASDVLKIDWRLGMTKPYDTLAAPTFARITVRNISRAYSSEYTADDLKPGKPIRIQSNDGITTRTHFTGFIEHIDPLAGSQGERLAVIHAIGAEAVLGQQRIRLPPQVNITADTVIAAVLDATLLRYSPLAGYWLLDTVGHAELDSNTRLAGSIPRSLESGRSAFAYTADTWDEGVSALEAVRQMTDSERGRFFTNRSGQLVFYNRHHTLLNTTAVASFSDNMDGLDYSYGADIANQVEVTMLPRSLGLPNTRLWKLVSPQLIQPGETGIRRIIAPYRDANNRAIGAAIVNAPIPNVDYQANTLPDGTGSNQTSALNIVVMEASASAALLEIRNTGNFGIYLLAGAQLVGTPLITGDPALVARSDYASANQYGLRRFSLDTPALTSIEEADQLARYELARRKDPRGTLHSIELSGTLHLTQILTRTLFDRITIHDTQTNHTGDYFIIAEEHTVDLGGARHHTRWLLEPAAASTFWTLDTSTLNQTTILAY
ncbi:MAG: hypothetical protein GC179_20635 [Anaerolineaceae bacterium]|nr:hypothetical protein [Anaerolineaceae bacterium]